MVTNCIFYPLNLTLPLNTPITENFLGFYIFKKTFLSMIYKPFSLWGPKKFPTRTRIMDIAIFVGTFCPNYVGFTRPDTHACTHIK